MRERLTLRDLPEQIPDKVIEPKLAALRKALEGNEQALAERHTARTQHRTAAEKADTEAFAAAIQAGKPDPGPKNVEKFEAQLRDLERKVTAYETLIGRLRGELNQAIDEQGAAFIARYADTSAKLAKKLIGDLNQIKQSGAELAEALRLPAWIRTYPERGWASAKPASALIRLGSVDLSDNVPLGELAAVAHAIVQNQASDKLRVSDPMAWARQEVARGGVPRCTWRRTGTFAPCGSTDDLVLMNRAGEVIEEITSATPLDQLVFACPEHRQREVERREEKAAAA